MDKLESMRVLREGNVSDALIAAAFGTTRQNVHKLLGPRQRSETLCEMPEISAIDFPAQLKAWRKKHGLSIIEAAELIGVSPSIWGQWEIEYRRCTFSKVLLLCLTLLGEKMVRTLHSGNVYRLARKNRVA